MSFWSKVKTEVSKDWAKGRVGEWQRDDGPVCLYGAIMRVVRQESDNNTSFPDKRAEELRGQLRMLTGKKDHHHFGVE